MPEYDELPEASKKIFDEWRQGHEDALEVRRDPNWLAEHPFSERTIESVLWWHEAREKVAGLDPDSLGSGNCQDWVNAMKPVIQACIDSNRESGLTLNHLYSPNHDHHWLEIERRAKRAFGLPSRERYLFDGTAGQKDTLDPSANLGRYGRKNEVLKRIHAGEKQFGDRTTLVKMYEGGKVIK